MTPEEHVQRTVELNVRLSAAQDELAELFRLYDVVSLRVAETDRQLAAIERAQRRAPAGEPDGPPQA